MAIGDAVGKYRKESGMSQTQLAKHLHFDRSYISRIESGEREWPEEHDSKLAKWSWKMANRLADERTGGYISDILKLVPNYDLHPSAAKEVLQKDLHEAIDALDKLYMAKHISPISRKLNAENAWHETRDVLQKALVMLGVLEDEFELDRAQLTLEHDHQVKNGER